jgi:hypothetical protein
MEDYRKMVEEHPQKVMATQKRDWDIRLPIILLAYRMSTSTTGLTPDNLTFRREFHLPCHRLDSWIAARLPVVRQTNIVISPA